jgi:hypothetical protein
VSCEKTDAGKPTVDYTINGKGIKAIPSGVKSVRASVEGYGTVAEAPVENGGFELALPATLPDKALSSVADSPCTKGVTASDHEARLAFLSLEFDGSFVSISFDNSHLNVDDDNEDDDSNEGDDVKPVTFSSRKALFVYADRPVTLSGEARWEQVAKTPLPIGNVEAQHLVKHTTTWVEVTLAAGWNRVCAEEGVTLGSDLYELKNVISHKNLDDCRWNVLAPTPAPTPKPEEKPVS